MPTHKATAEAACSLLRSLEEHGNTNAKAHATIRKYIEKLLADNASHIEALKACRTFLYGRHVDLHRMVDREMAKAEARPPKAPEWRDYSIKFAPLWESPVKPDQIRMYSYERPANMIWNAIMNGMRQGGMTEKQAFEWLQSKSPRWMLDGEFGDLLNEIGLQKGRENAKHFLEEKRSKRRVPSV
jgi:hypothetical protein